MSSVRCVAVVMLTLAASSCRCGGSTLKKSVGELVVVEPTADGETLSHDGTVAGPSVAMNDTDTGAVLFRNIGNGALTITGATNEGSPAIELGGIVGQVIEPQQELSATVTFSPPQDPDPTKLSVEHQAKFQLQLSGIRADDSTSVTVVAQALARDCYVPAVIDFGAVPPGQRISIPLVLQNGAHTESTTTLGDITGADPAFFGHDQTTIDVVAGARVEAPVWFAPTAERSYSASMVVQRGGSCSPVTVSLLGRGLTQAISWNPTSLEFGKIPLGEKSKPQTITLVNQSNATLHFANLTSSLTEFSVNTSVMSVGPGSSATFVVACAPTTLGKLTATFGVDLDTQPVTPVRVALTCQGGGPKIRVVPTPLAMGQAPFNGPNMLSIIRRLSVQNVGTSPPQLNDTTNNLMLGFNGQPPFVGVLPLTVDTSASEFEVTVPPTYSPTKGIAAIAGANAVDLEVRFKPKSLGLKQALIYVYSNDATNPSAAVQVTAEAVTASTCALTVTPSAVSFGDTPRGGTSQRTITVNNDASTPCLLAGIDLAAGSSPAFSMLTLGQLVVPGKSRAFLSVGLLVPADSNQGDILRGTVRLYPGGKELLIPLEAKVTSCLVVAPTALAFGATAVGCRSAELPIDLYNTCSVPLLLKSVTSTANFRVMSAPAIPAEGLELTATPVTIGSSFVPAKAVDTLGSLTLVVSEAGVERSVIVPLSGKGTLTSNESESWMQGQGDIDILFVVDDSCSMADEQVALANNFDSFIQHAQQTGANFHLGVTTTDIFSVNGAMKGNPAFLTPATPNLNAEFGSRAKVGTTGSGFEQPFEGLLRAVTPPQSTGVNVGFLRDGVPLAAVIVTDAVEQSPKSVATYVAQLRAVKKNRTDLVNVSVVGPFTQPPGCMLDTTTEDGRYAQIIAATRGAKGDICTTNWASDLDNIGKTVLGLNSQFVLSAAPSGPVSVTVDGVSVSNWSLDSSTGTIIFTKPPSPNSVVQASYKTVCNAP